MSLTAQQRPATQFCIGIGLEGQQLVKPFKQRVAGQLFLRSGAATLSSAFVFRTLNLHIWPAVGDAEFTGFFGQAWLAAFKEALAVNRIPDCARTLRGVTLPVLRPCKG